MSKYVNKYVFYVEQTSFQGNRGFHILMMCSNYTINICVIMEFISIAV